MKIDKYRPFVYMTAVLVLFSLKISCNQQDCHSILELQEVLEHSPHENYEYSLLESNSRKIKNKVNSHLQLSATNKTNTGNKSQAGNYTAIISKAPFRATKCDQILMFPGKRIFPENDFGKKSEAFFTMSALLLNTFEKKDSSKLVKSVKLKNVNEVPHVLQGSKNCLLFSEGPLRTNTTVCIEDAKQRQDIVDSFKFLKKCIKPKPYKFRKNRLVKRDIKKNPKSFRAQMQQLKKFFKTIENPNQQLYEIPKVREEIIKQLNKKGIKATINSRGRKHDDKIRNAKLKNGKKGKRKFKVPGTP